MSLRRLGWAALFVAIPASAGAVRLAERQVGDDWGPAYLDLIGYLQPRIEFVSDDTRCPTGMTDCLPEQRIRAHDFGGDGFALRRARAGFAGRLHELLGFQILIELARTSPALMDGYIDMPFVPELQLRVGQFKTPFSRGLLVPDSRLQFVETSLLVAGGLADRNPSNLGVPGRDLGFMVTSAIGDGTLVEVMAGVFNGEGINVAHNPDDGKLLVVRLAAHPFGAPGRLEESDVAREDEPRLSLALDFATDREGGEGRAAEIGDDGLPTPNAYESVTNLYGGDLAFFYGGLSFYSELLYRWRDSSDPLEDDEVGFGFSLQTGYLLPFEDLDRHVELAFRYDQYDPIRCTSFDCPANVPPPSRDDDELRGRRTYTIGTNFFFTGDHTWKLQLNYVAVAEMEGIHVSDDAFLIQMTAHL